jgi:type I restriction enzyme S subunit
VERAKWLLNRQRRAVRPQDGIVTAFRDGQVTLRENRRLEGFTNALQEIGYQGIRRGDLVVHGMDGFAGAIGVSDSDGKASPVVHAYRPSTDVDARYMAYILRTMAVNGYVATLAKGIRERSTAFDSATLANVLLPVPPLQEQLRIADFLDVETDRVNQLLRKLESQHQLVVEREEASVPLTVAGALLHSQPVKTGVPWMPMMHPDAEVVPLLRVLQLQRGVDLAESQRVDGTVPVVTTAGLSGWHNQSIAEGPGVVIRRYGSRGNVHWVDSDYWPHNTTLYVKNFNGNNRRYCYHLLRSLPFEMEQAKSAIPGVNRNDLHRLHVAVLPYSLQEPACRALDSDMAKFQATRERIEKLGQLLAERRQALVTAAVTGQFDVSTASGRNVTEGVLA